MWPFSRKTKDTEERASSVENPEVSLQDPRAFELLFGEEGDAAGERVSPETLLQVPAGWAAVNFLSGTIASLPLNLYRRGEQGRERVERTTLDRILHDAVNPEWTSYQWRRYSMIRTLTGGRSLTFIERNGAGQVMNLWPLNPQQVTVEEKVENSTPTKIYRWTSDRGDKVAEYKANEIIDLPWMLAADQVKHVSPTAKLKKAIGLALALETYATKFFKNGGVPPVALEGPAMSPGASERASKDIKKAIRRAMNEGSVPSLPTGYTLKPVGVDPEKSQLKDARRFQVEEFARIFDLPPVFLQDLTNGTYSNTEQQDLHFVKHTLTQWLRCWEQELNLKLFPGRNRQGLFVEFNVDGLLRGDFKSRMEGYATAIQNSIRTPNEVRAKENLEPKAGGDDLVLQQNMIPLGRLGDLAAGQPRVAPDGEGEANA